MNCSNQCALRFELYGCNVTAGKKINVQVLVTRCIINNYRYMYYYIQVGVSCVLRLLITFLGAFRKMLRTCAIFVETMANFIYGKVMKCRIQDQICKTLGNL